MIPVEIEPETHIEIDAFNGREGSIQLRLNVALRMLRRGENVRICYFHERGYALPDRFGWGIE